MRIGFDARTIDWSGIGTYSRNLLQQFGKGELAGDDVEFVVFCPDQKRESVPRGDRFSLVSTNIDPRSHSGRAVFARMVEQSGVDILHVPSHYAPIPVGVPVVATIHDVIPLIYPRTVRNPVARVRYRRQLDRVLGAARCIITVSQISLATLTAFAGVEASRVRVIHNGVSSQFHPVENEAERASARRRYGLPERFALWIGDFRPNKNLEFMVGGWAALQKVLDVPLTLAMAGAQEGEFRKIAHEAERRGLKDRVVFPGFVREDDLAAVYSSAAVFVFPSLYEGFGLPPLEAMACGTPCVVSNSSALPEVTGRAAMMFNPTSVEQFVDCIHRVLTEPDLNGNLRREGLCQSARFGWERAAAETIEVYRTMVA
ncbi:MAG TPA: glycosyltransferase family 1 protein [Thermoleophilia bacterium]|nr:glycosyltransferase family 1 protein [Thermoleophilia bacterium]